MLMEGLDEVVVQLERPIYQPVHIRVELAIHVVLHIDKGDQSSRVQHGRLRTGGEEIGRNAESLIVLNDAHKHYALIAADGGLSGRLHMQLGIRLINLIGDAVQAGPQVESEVLRWARSNGIHISKPQSFDNAELGMPGLLQNGAHRQIELLNEVLEPTVSRGLQKDTGFRDEDAPVFVSRSVFPTFLFGNLNRAGGRPEGYLLHLASPLDGEASLTEFFLYFRYVPRHLADGAKPDLAKH